MQVSVTTTKGLERRLEVTVPGERVAGEVDQRLKRLARTAKLKGFRPGKVPYAVVRQQFGQQVHAEAIHELMQRSFAEAVSREKLKPAGGPRIEPLAGAPESNELRYAAVFEIMPEIVLKPVDALQIERPMAQITEADVDAMVDNLRAQRPVFTPTGQPATTDNRVTLAYEGRIDGEIFPGGKGDALQVTIGQHRILPEIEQALIGMSIGDSQSVAATFPEDYGAKSVAGKPAQFQITVTNIEQHSLPELDEVFVKGFGIETGGAEALRAEVRRNMEREVAEMARSRVREQVLDALYRDNPIDVPRALVEEQIQEMQQQALRRMGSQDPAKVQTPEARAAFEQPAQKRVALGLIMGEIVRGQQLKVDRERVEQRLEAVTAQYPDPAAVRRQYLASREAMEQLESAALEDQALDWILSQAKVSEKTSTFRELTGFGQSAAAQEGT